jgi:hypothetical protein
MKLTKDKLEQIIREELNTVLQEGNMELLEEGWKDYAIAGAIGLGTLLNPATGQAATPDIPAAAQTQVAEQAEHVTYANAALGYIQQYINSKKDVSERAELSQQLMRAQLEFSQMRKDENFDIQNEEAKIILDHIANLKETNPNMFQRAHDIGKNITIQ